MLDEVETVFPRAERLMVEEKFNDYAQVENRDTKPDPEYDARLTVDRSPGALHRSQGKLSLAGFQLAPCQIISECFAYQDAGC